MKITILFAGLVSLICCSSFAGGDWFDKGNGGYVLSCSDSALKTFDLHELEHRYKWTIDNRALDSVESRVLHLLSKLETLNPTRARLYRQWFASFNEESFFVENNTIQPINDIGYGAIPDGCSVEQVVFHRTPGVLNKFRYMIRGDLWNKLDTYNKAAMILHEFFYREATFRENRHMTSEPSRYLTAKLNSKEFAADTEKDFLLLLQALHFHTADFGGHKIVLGSYSDYLEMWVPTRLEFYPNGNLHVAGVSEWTAVSRRLIHPSYVSCFAQDDQLEYGQLEFSPRGELLAARVSMVAGRFCEVGSADGRLQPLRFKHMGFYSDGRVDLAFDLGEQSYVTLDASHFDLSTAGEGIVFLYLDKALNFKRAVFPRALCRNESATVVKTQANVSGAPQDTFLQAAEFEKQILNLPLCLP